MSLKKTVFGTMNRDLKTIPNNHAIKGFIKGAFFNWSFSCNSELFKGMMD
ncbi:hypothetical protein BB14905_14780 [Bacillus sp. B14905]|nr:hypothetical protein BB14905_14780 [Bacillus sp. B14905]